MPSPLVERPIDRKIVEENLFDEPRTHSRNGGGITKTPNKTPVFTWSLVFCFRGEPLISSRTMFHRSRKLLHRRVQAAARHRESRLP